MQQLCMASALLQPAAGVVTRPQPPPGGLAVSELRIKKFIAKIGEANAASLALFAKLEYTEYGRAPAFQEVHLQLEAAGGAPWGPGRVAPAFQEIHLHLDAAGGAPWGPGRVARHQSSSAVSTTGTVGGRGAAHGLPPVQAPAQPASGQLPPKGPGSTWLPAPQPAWLATAGAAAEQLRQAGAALRRGAYDAAAAAEQLEADLQDFEHPISIEQVGGLLHLCCAGRLGRMCAGISAPLPPPPLPATCTCRSSGPCATR